MILSGPSIRERIIFTPFNERTTHDSGLTFGLGPAGYDVRVAQTIDLRRGEFSLASTIEHFTMPFDCLAVVHDKSTWARSGLALQNTVIEPGWRGYLTLELSNHGSEALTIHAGMPIAQIIFHVIDRPGSGYFGRYQDQQSGPQPAIWRGR